MQKFEQKNLFLRFLHKFAKMTDHVDPSLFLWSPNSQPEYIEATQSAISTSFNSKVCRIDHLVEELAEKFIENENISGQNGLDYIRHVNKKQRSAGLSSIPFSYVRDGKVILETAYLETHVNREFRAMETLTNGLFWQKVFRIDSESIEIELNCRPEDLPTTFAAHKTVRIQTHCKNNRIILSPKALHQKIHDLPTSTATTNFANTLPSTLFGQMIELIDRGYKLSQLSHFFQCSNRATQRQLAKKGLKFSELQDFSKLVHTIKTLQTSPQNIECLSINELGFSHPMGLYKTCKRWFDLSPGELRHILQRDASLH